MVRESVAGSRGRGVASGVGFPASIAEARGASAVAPGQRFGVRRRGRRASGRAPLWPTGACVVPGYLTRCGGGEKRAGGATSNATRPGLLAVIGLASRPGERTGRGDEGIAFLGNLADV